MGQAITLTAKDGHKLAGYRADPAGKPRGAIVLIQEIFGVNGHIRRVADGFAKEGYAVVAPALFDRVEKNIELGYGPKDVEAGRDIRTKVPLDGSLADLEAAIAYAKQFGKVGVVGYCWGGSLAFLSATRLDGVAAAVGYYGGMVAQHANEKPRAPTMLHFGDEDQSIPMSDVEKVQKARPDVTTYVYHAGHGFNCDERGSWSADNAKVALDRTLKFLGEHVG
jgi:carboxymethylenebutenolidase